MKRAGLQEKSSLGVEGSVEYNGAVSALRSFPAREAVKGAAATSPAEAVYRGGSRLGRRSGDSRTDDGQAGSNAKVRVADDPFGMRT
jgi:hypothetical protein